jgi:hypothetical protein
LLGFAVAFAAFASGYILAGTDAFRFWFRVFLVLICVLAGLAAFSWAAAMSHVGVRISAYSLRIRHGLLPFLSTSVPLRTVRKAQAIEVPPGMWYRWGWTGMPGRSLSIVVRSGPALQLDVGGGRSLIVSVDAPHEAVDAIQQMRAPR